MKKILILLLMLIFTVGSIPTASASATLTVGTISYDSTVVKDESITVTSSVTAASVSGTLTVDVTLTDNSGLFSIPTATQQLQFTTDGTKAVSWTITATSTGTNVAPFTISASGDDDGFGSKTSSSVVTVKDRPVITVTGTTDKSSVAAGDSVTVSYQVSNSAAVGAADATNVEIALTRPSGWSLTSGTTSYDLSTIAPGASKAGSWIVKADSPASSNTFTLSVTSTIPGGTVTTTKSITGPSSSTSTDTSGGGGGGGTSAEAYANIAVKNVVKKFTNKDMVEKYAFEDALNPVGTVEFMPIVNAGYISVSVEVLKDVSGLVSSSPPGLVYKNLNIWVGSGGWATSNTISDPKVTFSVDKSWISENNINPASVKLLRYTTQWTELETTKTGEDAGKIYYSAETPGFSPFAITAQVAEGTVSSGTVSSDAAVAETAANAEKATISAAVEEEETSGGIPGFEAVIAVGLLGAAYLLQRRML